MFIYYLEASKDNEVSTDELKHYVDLTYQMDEELMKSEIENQDMLFLHEQNPLAKYIVTKDSREEPGESIPIRSDDMSV